jgi:hypothetical protein
VVGATARRIVLGSVPLAGSGTLVAHDTLLRAIGSASLIGNGTLSASSVLSALYRPLPSTLVEVVPAAWAEAAETVPIASGEVRVVPNEAVAEVELVGIAMGA